MWQDPIIKQTRELRERYFEQFNDDSDSLFADILKRQQETSREKVTFPPKKPKPSHVA